MTIEEYDAASFASLQTCDHLKCSCEALLWTGLEWKSFHDMEWSSGNVEPAFVFTRMFTSSSQYMAVVAGKLIKAALVVICCSFPVCVPQLCLGSEAFTSSFSICKREMRASLILPADFRGFMHVRSQTSVKGTPPDCADTFSLSLRLKSTGSLPSEVAAVRCPADHDCLPFFFSSDRHSCDRCSSSIAAASQGWRCLECNYDVCHSCHQTHSYDADPESVISSQSANGLCSDEWRTICLNACASGDHFVQPGGQFTAEANTLFVHFSISGQDAEKWSGHHGAKFACSSVSYLSKVRLHWRQMHHACDRIAFVNVSDFACVLQVRCGLLSYFEPRPVEIPFKCNFCTGALFA
jgi:hypothetical protein